MNAFASSAPRVRRFRLFAALAIVVSLLVAFVLGEALLRWVLFHTAADVGAKDATYYARNGDELWIYRYWFAPRHAQGFAGDRLGSSAASRIEFYRNWGTSLMPDATLGYVRRPNVRTPCHETTARGARGLVDVPDGGPRIAFFGDSFVESAACADDTLTTKLERASGTPTLNFGVGSYGLDQMLLYAERVVPSLRGPDTLVLVGLIQDDLERVLLTVRTSPKPYFTTEGSDLVLHTAHIHPQSLEDGFERPPFRLYLVDFLRGRFGTPVYTAFQRATRESRRERVHAIAERIAQRFAALGRREGSRIAFVLLPAPGPAFDPDLAADLRAPGLPVIDLQDCLRASGQPDADLYAELHPTSLGNTLLAGCLAAALREQGLVR